MKRRLTDNEFHTSGNKERACYIQEPRLQAIYDKLFELEDIEEELGIDLVTLFKALKNGVYTDTDIHIDKNKASQHKHFHFNYCVDDKFTIWLGRPHELKDYGKTWALTKEELEK